MPPSQPERLGAHFGQRSFGDALSMQLGPDEVLLNLDVEFSPEVSGRDLPGAIQRLEGRIREAHPEITRIFVEALALLRP